LAGTENCTSELDIEIPWVEVEKESDKALKGLSKGVRVPGFRQGKAPKSVLKMRFKDEIKSEVLERLLPKYFWEKAEADNLKVVGTPDVADLHFEDNEPVKFKAVFEVFPDYELGNYRRLEVPYLEPVVEDSDVDAELERLRESQASYRNLDPRPLADGDLAVFSLKSEPVDDSPAVDQEETTLTIGADETLPDFSNALRGKSPDDEVDFEVTYPDDFASEKLAGKSIPFHAKVLGIREKELPELDDDFAKDVDAQFETFDALKSRIREGMLDMRRNQGSQRAKDQLVDQLVKAHDFPLPKKLVDQQIGTRLENNLRSLSQQGVDVKSLDIDWQKIGESERPRAEHDVKASLLLGRIADVENIQADDSQIDGEIERYAEQNQLTPGGARKKLAEDGTLDRMKSFYQNEKVLNFLFDEAEKVDPPEEPAGEPEVAVDAEVPAEESSE
jgi:trigger factor